MSQKTKLQKLWTTAVEDQNRESIIQLWDVAVSLFESDNYENLDDIHPQYRSSSFATYMRIRRALAYDVVPQDGDVI